MRNNVGRSLVFVSIALGMAGVYQNCAPMTAAIGQFESSSVGATSKTILEADLSWSMKEKRPVFNRFNRAERWGNMQTGASVNLYPPFITNTSTLNLDNSGVLEMASTREMLRLNPEASLSPAVADVSELIFDRATMFMLIQDLKMPEGTAEPLRLFGFWPQTGDLAGVLVIDVSPVATGGLKFTALDWFNADYASREISISAAEAAGPIAIGVRFDKSAGSMQIAINGKLAESAVNSVGNVPPLGLVSRAMTIHASNTYGSKGSFLLGEFAIYKRALSDNELAIGSSQLALSYNGVAVVPTPEPTPITTLPTPSTEVTGASLYATNCQACHGVLASSAKKGATAAQITNAINIVSTMSGLSSLSAADREKIAAALK